MAAILLKNPCLRLLVLVAGVLFSALVRAENVTLDSGFGKSGKVITSLDGYNIKANALKVQADGKLVVIGTASHSNKNDFLVMRYNPDGTLDNSFGKAGVVVTAVGSDVDQAYALVIQADGKIVAAGSSHNGTNLDFALLRYNADGTLDSSFGKNGKVTTEVGSGTDVIHALIVDSNGKLVAAGYSYSGSGNHIAMVRYNPDGTLDTSFGSSGKVIAASDSTDEVAFGLIQQRDGNYVLAGRSHQSEQHIVVLRYKADGTLDASFGKQGKVITAVSTLNENHASDEARVIAQQPNGKLVVSGFACVQFDFSCQRNELVLLRYNTDGTLDNDFGSGGKVELVASTGNATGHIIPDHAYALAIQDDGKLLVAGDSYNHDPDYLVARFNKDGSLDTHFGNGGIITTTVGDGEDSAAAMALPSTHTLIMAGHSRLSGQDTVSLVRYVLDSQP